MRRSGWGWGGPRFSGMRRRGARGYAVGRAVGLRARERGQLCLTRLFSGAGTVYCARSSERDSHRECAASVDAFTAPSAVNSPPRPETAPSGTIHGEGMTTQREVEGILREFCLRQCSVATRRQLLGRGLPAHRLDRLVQSKRLVVIRRGLYQIGPVPAPRGLEMAALLAGGSTSRISHRTAAGLHGLREVSCAGAVEITMSRRMRCTIPGVVIHRIGSLREDEVLMLDRLRVTTPARTLLDIAAELSSREVEQALASALRRGLVTRAEMHGMVLRHPTHRGAALLEALLEDEPGPAFTRSQAEEALLALVRAARLPRPELNVSVLGHEVDFLWRLHRLVAEVDGYAFHNSARSFAADRRRDAELTAAGYRVLRFTWPDLTEGRLATAVQLAQALSHAQAG